MLLRLAKRRRVETDFVVRGKTTASGLCAANHLSPAYFSRTESWKKTSPEVSNLFNCERFLNFEVFIKLRLRCTGPTGTKSFRGRISGGKKITSLDRLTLRYLHANASRRTGITFHTHCSEFTHHNSMKSRCLKS